MRERGGLEIDRDLGAGIRDAASRAVASSTSTGTRPFFSELLRKISANSVLTTALNAVVRQRPGRVLARGAAAEVAARDEDRAALRFGLVQREVRAGLAVGVVAPLGEEVLAEAFARGGAQEAGRDDLVGVDVRERQYRRARTNGFDGFHA